MESKSFFSLWYVRALMVLGLIAIVGALAAYANLAMKQARYSNYGPTTINVRGEGEVFAKPDIGQFTFSVRAEGDDAETAQTQSAEAMNAILAYLKEAGVQEDDVKTTGYYLSPKYTYPDRVCAVGMYCPPYEAVEDGYEVSQMVEVKIRNLEQSGELIAGVGARGATDVSGLSFTIDDESVVKADARAIAISDAQEKAEQLADQLGVRIVRMIGYYEEEMYPMYDYGYGGDMMMKAESAAVSPRMPMGENSITSTVNITYEIR